jgi:hypothetical protein
MFARFLGQDPIEKKKPSDLGYTNLFEARSHVPRLAAALCPVHASRAWSGQPASFSLCYISFVMTVRACRCQIKLRNKFRRASKRLQPRPFPRCSMATGSAIRLRSAAQVTPRPPPFIQAHNRLRFRIAGAGCEQRQAPRSVGVPPTALMRPTAHRISRLFVTGGQSKYVEELDRNYLEYRQMMREFADASQVRKTTMMTRLMQVRNGVGALESPPSTLASTLCVPRTSFGDASCWPCTERHASSPQRQEGISWTG